MNIDVNLSLIKNQKSNYECVSLFIFIIMFVCCGIVKSEEKREGDGWEQRVGSSRGGMNKTTPTAAGTDFCATGSHSMNFGCPFTFPILSHVTYFICRFAFSFHFNFLNTHPLRKEFLFYIVNSGWTNNSLRIFKRIKKKTTENNLFSCNKLF